MSAKAHRITRRIKSAVWVIPNSYGYSPPRGCSRKIPIVEFRREWLPIATKDGLDTPLFFRRSTNENNQKE